MNPVYCVSIDCIPIFYFMWVSGCKNTMSIEARGQSAIVDLGTATQASPAMKKQRPPFAGGPFVSLTLHAHILPCMLRHHLST